MTGIGESQIVTLGSFVACLHIYGTKIQVEFHVVADKEKLLTQFYAEFFLTAWIGMLLSLVINWLAKKSTKTKVCEKSEECFRCEINKESKTNLTRY